MITLTRREISQFGLNALDVDAHGLDEMDNKILTTIIDKFTATNYGATTATISVNLVTVLDVAGNQNLIVKTKTLQPSECYTFPEIGGHILSSGSFISTIASAATSINIRASGRVVT